MLIVPIMICAQRFVQCPLPNDRVRGHRRRKLRPHMSEFLLGSLLFKIQDDSGEFIGLRRASSRDLTRRMAVAVPIPSAFAICRQLEP